MEDGGVENGGGGVCWFHRCNPLMYSSDLPAMRSDGHGLADTLHG